MNTLWKSKIKAFAYHLLYSALIIGIFMALVTQIWFPGILFELENVWEGLQILIPVDAILGPLLTLIIFIPGKKGLKGDLIIIGLIQVLALVYGGWAIYGQRPELMVFTGDRFEIVRSSKFDRENFAKDYFTETEPYPFPVYALPAQTIEEQTKFMFENVQYQLMSERYRPLQDHKEKLLSRALDVNKFDPQGKKSQTIFNEFKRKYNVDEIYLFVLEGTTGESRIIILDKQSFRIAGYLNLDPWTVYKP